MDIGARAGAAGGPPGRQHGLTILGFLLVAAVVVIFAMVGFRVIPSYIEYQSVRKALDDTMRGEPPFLLQGSYRNMAKVASKVVGPMTDAEVDALIADHYRAEAQTLAGAASWNLARLAEVQGRVGPDAGDAAELRARWAEDKAAENPVVQVRAGLTGIEEALRSLPRPL